MTACASDPQIVVKERLIGPKVDPKLRADGGKVKVPDNGTQRDVARFINDLDLANRTCQINHAATWATLDAFDKQLRERNQEAGTDGTQ